MAKPRDFFQDNAKRLPPNVNVVAPVMYNLHHGFNALIMQVDRLESQVNALSKELASLREELSKK
jgi:hypothetical protein